jgi:lysylphosphatidylglycerol synthetase-like protein (DUF2156 family)
VAALLRRSLGAEVALAVELAMDTGGGVRRVRVEPGSQLDPLMRVNDPHDPAESPLGHHLVCEVLPALGDSTAGRSPREPGQGWLAGWDSLDDPASFPRFLASRLTYRRLARHAWVLALPVVVALALRLPFAVFRHAHRHVGSATRIGVFVALFAVLGLVLVGTVVAMVVRGTWRSLAGVALSRGRPDDWRDPNGAGRARARELVTAGYSGLVTGHTAHPELTYLGDGFYANTGCAAEVVSESPARLEALGAPSLFLAHRQVSWLEVEAGHELHVRLLHGQRALPGTTVFERLLRRRPATSDGRPERQRGQGSGARTGSDAGWEQPVVVASFPHGSSWPAPVAVDRRLRRVRRWSASLVGLAGVVSLVSALLAPMRQRLSDVLRIVPLAVPQTADALVALASLGLLALARSVRRGQRRAWVIAEVLLLASAVLHLIKGIDVEEAATAALVAGYLFVNRDAFRAAVDRPSTRRGLMTLLWGAALTMLTGTLAVEVGTVLSASRHHRRLALPQAYLATVQRLVGQHSVGLPDRLDDFFAPTMLAIAIGLGLAVAYLLSRPVVARHLGPGARSSHPASESAESSELLELSGARDVVRRFGSGTLDYFALRSDKRFFFWGQSVVAYGVYGGVCLVSPDPIGPPAEREEVWKAFRCFADGHGWTLAVMGAGEEWLPIYRASGMHDMYVGDEAVVDCSRFSLEGGRFKGLRQAVNRIAKYGYTITFHDPATIDPSLRRQLQGVMTKSRRGDVERGFSMTLGRAFDASDDGLLLAVVWGPGSTEPVAFCQYVPAPGIDGYSLDLMRRDNEEHPNGLLDFAVVSTIRHLQAEGKRGLGLNFATMRAVLAGELGEGISQRVQAWLLRRMSDSMQIESLWKFNAKFDPDWQPRYALYDSPEHALPAAIAVARAESFWELPVIGRFLVPSGGAVGPGAGEGDGDQKGEPVPVGQGNPVP